MTPADYPAVACATGMRHPVLLELRGIVKADPPSSQPWLPVMTHRRGW